MGRQGAKGRMEAGSGKAMRVEKAKEKGEEGSSRYCTRSLGVLVGLARAVVVVQPFAFPTSILRAYTRRRV